MNSLEQSGRMVVMLLVVCAIVSFPAVPAFGQAFLRAEPVGPPVRAGDRQGRENISRYLIRAPFSVDKIQYSCREGSAIYKTKMVKGPNRNFQVYDPRLATVTTYILDRREHLVRYYGWYSSVQRGIRRKQGLEEKPLEAPPIEAPHPPPMPPAAPGPFAGTDLKSVPLKYFALF